jgi:hypothetical protein
VPLVATAVGLATAGDSGVAPVLKINEPPLGAVLDTAVVRSTVVVGQTLV